MATETVEELTGKVCIITGASAGIGKELARGLACRGASVVLAVRRVNRGEMARAEIVKEGHNLDVLVMQLDLSSMANIRDFAQRFRRHHEKLHLLVNNASSWQPSRAVTEEGLELTWATNVLGPYLLTESLRELLQAGAPSRVVNLAPSAVGHLELSDVQFEQRRYDGFKAYMQSKQALRMLTWGLARRLAGTGVTANAVNPGFVRSELSRPSGLIGALIPIFARIMAKTPTKGAETPLWVCTSPELATVSGRFFSERGHETPCEFDDPAQIAELERLCADLVRPFISA